MKRERNLKEISWPNKDPTRCSARAATAGLDTRSRRCIFSARTHSPAQDNLMLMIDRLAVAASFFFTGRTMRVLDFQGTIDGPG